MHIHASPPPDSAIARRRARRRAARWRISVVRAAKAHKEALGLMPILTDAELDAVLPPVVSRRRIGAIREGFFGRACAVRRAAGLDAAPHAGGEGGMGVGRG